LWAEDGGLFRTYGPAKSASTRGRIERNQPDRWELENVSLRMWPGATPVQVLLTALLEKPDSLPRADNVHGVTVRLSPTLWNAHHALQHPTGTFESLLSYHFATATALVYGEMRPEHAVEPVLRDDPRVRQVSDKVRLVADPGLTGAAVCVEIETAAGIVRLGQEHALGSPALPADREQVVTKFRNYAASRLGPAASERLLAGLSDLTSVASLATLLVEAGAPDQSAATQRAR
jgi:2-methylcitrate dehydratase PrpD